MLKRMLRRGWGMVLLLWTAGLSAQGVTELRVAAAADLQPVLPGIIAAFEQQNHAHIGVTYGASGVLTTQIENGAPFDVFLAADMGFPLRVIAAGQSADAQPALIARGTLVLWQRRDQAKAMPPLTIDALTSPAVKKIAIANPKTAPYGRAAMSSLEKLGLLPQVKDKLVTAENIAQAAQFAESGNADVGLISENSAARPPLTTEGMYIKMPADSYPAIEQGGIVLRNAKDTTLAHAFVSAVANAMLQPKH